MPSSSYPKKYWWLILVVVPLTGALIAVLPSLIGGSKGGGSGQVITIEGASVGGSVQLVGRQTIINELQTTVHNSEELSRLSERVDRAINLMESNLFAQSAAEFEAVAQKAAVASVYNNIGALRLHQGDAEAAKSALEESAALAPASSPLRENLATLYEKQGRISDAIAQLERVEPTERVTAWLARLREIEASRAEESEPNDRPELATPLAPDRTTLAAIKGETDVDYFAFQTPRGPRDLFKIQLLNQSTESKLKLTILDRNKGVLWYNATYPHQVSAGHNLETVFHPKADTLYYIAVSPLAGNGDYGIALVPQNAYDTYEPNDSLLEPTDVASPSTIEASLLDQDDLDYYRIPLKSDQVSIRIVNRSTEMRPRLTIWTADKSRIWANATYPHQVSAGQDIKFEKAVPNSGGALYVEVASLDGAGDYQLIIAENP